MLDYVGKYECLSASVQYFFNCRNVIYGTHFVCIARATALLYNRVNDKTTNLTKCIHTYVCASGVVRVPKATYAHLLWHLYAFS